MGNVTHAQKPCPLWADGPSLCSNCHWALWTCGTHWLFGWDHSPGTSSPPHLPHALTVKGPFTLHLLPSPLLTCWAVPVSALTSQPQIFPTSCLVPAFTAVAYFPLHALWPDPYINRKRISWSCHHSSHSFPFSPNSPFSSAPYDLRCYLHSYHSLTWQTFFHFLWFLIYKTNLAYFSILPPLGPTPLGCLIFRLQRWQEVKEFDMANAVRVRTTEK